MLVLLRFTVCCCRKFKNMTININDYFTYSSKLVNLQSTAAVKIRWNGIVQNQIEISCWQKKALVHSHNEGKNLSGLDGLLPKRYPFERPLKAFFTYFSFCVHHHFTITIYLNFQRWAKTIGNQLIEEDIS